VPLSVLAGRAAGAEAPPFPPARAHGHLPPRGGRPGPYASPQGAGAVPKNGRAPPAGLSARFRPDGCYARKPTVSAVLPAVVASGGLAFAVLAGLDSSPAWQVARVVVVIAAIALAVWLTRRAGRPAGATGFAARGQPALWAAPGTPPTRLRGGHDPATAHLPPTFSHRLPSAEQRSRVPSGCAVRIAAADSLLTSSPSGPLAHAFSTSAGDLGAASRHDPERAARTSSGKPQPGGQFRRSIRQARMEAASRFRSRCSKCSSKSQQP